MTKIKIKSATEVGQLIDDAVAHVKTGGAMVHEAAVQCMAHAFAHGDVTLAQRLVDDLNNSSFNTKGLRYWFGYFAPMTARAGKWSLLDRDSEAYNKFVAARTAEFGEGDEQKNGKRLFWIDNAEAKPFWELDDVQNDQNQKIATQSTRTLLKLVTGLESRLDKMVEDKRFGGNPELAASFAAAMADAAKDWERQNKDVLRLEDVRMKAIKNAASKDDEPGASPQGELNTPVDPAKPDVGGDVTQGVTEPPAPVTKVA